MKNKTFRFLHLLPVIMLTGILYVNKQKEVSREIKREPTSLPKSRRPMMPKYNLPKTISRSPASVKPYSRHGFHNLVDPVENIVMSKGNVLAKNIAAIPLSDWKPGMSPLVYDDGVYGFFEKKPGEKSIPVAYNPATKSFHPISSVIHIRGVDESLRQEIKENGFTEYIYFKNIKKMSVKTAPADVVRTYQELEKRGYNVKLEVIQQREELH